MRVTALLLVGFTAAAPLSDNNIVSNAESLSPQKQQPRDLYPVGEAGFLYDAIWNKLKEGFQKREAEKQPRELYVVSDAGYIYDPTWNKPKEGFQKREAKQ